MGKKVIITGSTGMVGKAVLLECLDSSKIDKVLLINRNSVGIKHAKIEEILLKDFSRVDEEKEKLKGYEGCFHCMGVSAFGMSEKDYKRITYTYTKALADLLCDLNPEMVFNYVSGVGTDSSEKVSSMWARVKGKTENYILSLGFRDAYMIRLGVILPEKGIKSKTGWYNAMYVIMRPFFPLFEKSSNVITTTAFGNAMINTLFFQQDKKYLGNKELNVLALK